MNAAPNYDGWCVALNAQVKRLAESGKLQSLAENPEAIASVKAGAVVYQERSHLAVYFFWAVIGACLWLSPSPAYLALCVGLMMVYVDFYGAVLHVVLDHAPFVDLPIISAGCLEFQWHHAIPSDIVSKPFVEVCGDLNLVTLLHMAWILAVCQGYSNTAVNCMAGSKLLWAYAGQMSHRMAHTPESARPAWASAAQRLGLFVDPALHKKHHAVYDDGFPILNGVTAPLITWLNAAVPNRYAWLAFFSVASLADVFVLTALAKGLLGMQ